MRQSMTIRLDQDVLRLAKARAKYVNRTLTNYIETLIQRDITTNQRTHAHQPTHGLGDEPMSVFIAEPLSERLITDPRDGDTPEDIANRQEYLDIITGWGKGK